MAPVTGIDRTILGIALAVLAFGLSFGVLARASGLDAAQAVAMSVLVFAGSAQFAAVAALDGGASAVSAALAGVALNSRYLPLGLVVGRSLGGGLLGDPEALGLDAAFPALFLALIWPRLRAERGARRAALAAAALAAAGVLLLPAGLAVVVAAAGAAAALGAGPPAHPPGEPDPAEEAGP